MKKIIALYRGLPDKIKAGWSTAVVVFITVVIGQLFNIGDAVMAWSNGEAESIDLGTSVDVIASAFIAFIVGAANVALRWVQDKVGLGAGPKYNS